MHVTCLAPKEITPRLKERKNSGPLVVASSAVDTNLVHAIQVVANVTAFNHAIAILGIKYYPQGEGKLKNLRKANLQHHQPTSETHHLNYVATQFGG